MAFTVLMVEDLLRGAREGATDRIATGFTDFSFEAWAFERGLLATVF